MSWTPRCVTAPRPPATTVAEVWLRTGFYFEHLSRFRSLFAERSADGHPLRRPGP